MSKTEVINGAHTDTKSALGGGAVATFAQLALLIITFLPLIVPVPTNINIVVTASLCVLVGAVRSVKGTPPAESMTKKASLL